MTRRVAIRAAPEYDTRLDRPNATHTQGIRLEGKEVIVLGAGLPGLSAAHWLARQDVRVTVLERSAEIGGLARTILRDGYRFDYGGYRFIGSSTEIRELFRGLLGDDLLSVKATAKIHFRDHLYRYPLDPKDLIAGLGQRQATMALWSYTGSRFVRKLPFRAPPRNLEEWLLEEFGETLYRAFFRDYNEKIWGQPCHRLSAELASRRIRGVNLLGSLIKGALPGSLGGSAKQHEFLYPRLGIGELSASLAREVESKNSIRREATVTRVRVRRARVEAIEYRDHDGAQELACTNLISSIPLPRLVYMLDPRPPADVLASAQSLPFRDVISVCLELDRAQVTEDSWLYFPDPAIGFARLLEPRNWSEAMVPPGKTSLVAEYYVSEGDKTWSLTDEALVERTIEDLTERLHLIDRSEVEGHMVLRIKKPYPVYEIGYHEHLRRIHRYLKTIVNLQPIGRGGLF
ncbi:MAG: FAD-dependent oxidoreductase, partial [Planctomycetota bacterium]